jgi:hypothetical protein
MAALLGVTAGCGPIVRPAPFPGAADQVTDASLMGPFDGQIVDAATGQPIREAIVLGVWSFDRGDGFIGPAGSTTVEVTTDEAGRYRIEELRRVERGPAVRLVSFHLVVYRRGYAAFRSDRRLGGGPRHDFAARHNRIELQKWKESDSHLDHLLFLDAAPSIAKASRWERGLANQELYARLGGTAAVGGPVVAPEVRDGAVETSESLWLDARDLLPPQEVRLRTGDTEAFDVRDLTDLERTGFYHGVHLEASGRGEEWDVSLRVWLDPPDGLDPVVATFQTSLPDVPMSTDVTSETWVLDDENVRAVAFVDRERKAGILLTCGARQCADVDTMLILAKFVAGRLDRLRTIPAPPTAEPTGEPTPDDGPEPTPEEAPPTPEPPEAPP